MLAVLAGAIFCTGLVYFYIKSNAWSKLGEDTPKVCFTRNTEDGGSANIVLYVYGEKVSGVFDWEPAEKDERHGEFEGNISDIDIQGNQYVDALWRVIGEGTTGTEELKIKIGSGVAAPLFKGSSEYAPNLSLVDCQVELVN